MTKDNGFRAARYVRIHDGDTFRARVDLWPRADPDPMVEAWIRVRNWNADELREAEGPIMRDLMDALLRSAQSIDLRATGMSFARVVCDVYIDDQLFVGLLHGTLAAIRATHMQQSLTIPNLPDHLRAEHGVQMNPPPPDLMGPTQRIIENALKTAKFEDGQTTAVTWILTTKGVNTAVVKRFHDGKVDFDGAFWFGKTWGAPIEAGVAGQLKF